MRKIARKGALSSTSPEGDHIYRVRAIKSLQNGTGVESSEYSVYAGCVAQVNDAGGTR